MRVLVFSNSGSGKSTFVMRLLARHNLKMLNLDIAYARMREAKALIQGQPAVTGEPTQK
jgi:hypothetical protein